MDRRERLETVAAPARGASLQLDLRIEKFIANLDRTNRERKLEAADESLVDLCSNDYLCLSRHPRLIEALHEGIDRFGAGSTASRLVRGHRVVFDTLEETTADWICAEAVLFFANGYAANVGSIAALADSSFDVFIDRFAHASLVDGVRLSGARKIYFRHNDLAHLAYLLQKSAAANKMIVTETLFSMDGDCAPLAELLDLKKKYNALLYIDDAHAFGVYGSRGQGLADSRVDFRMATFGKALGLEGAFLATDSRRRKYLLHKARTFVFSTAPPPAIAFAALTAIALAQQMDEERKRIASCSQNLREAIQRGKYSAGMSTTHIVPILCANESEALALAARAHNAGIHCKAIRPPTVEQSRLRVSINAAVTDEVLQRLLGVLN